MPWRMILKDGCGLLSLDSRSSAFPYSRIDPPYQALRWRFLPNLFRFSSCCDVLWCALELFYRVEPMCSIYAYLSFESCDVLVMWVWVLRGGAPLQQIYVHHRWLLWIRWVKLFPYFPWPRVKCTVSLYCHVPFSISENTPVIIALSTVLGLSSIFWSVNDQTVYLS